MVAILALAWADTRACAASVWKPYAAAQTAPAVPSAPTSASLDAAKQRVSAGDFQGAENLLRVVIDRNAPSAEAHSLLAYCLLRINQPKDSLAEYTKAAALRTPSAEDLRNVANDYALLDDFSDADRWMSRSLQMNDRDAETWYDLGRIRYSLQRFQEAMQCFKKTLELSPQSVKAADNLGLAYEGLNRNADAMQSYRLALDWQKGAAHPSEQPMLNLATLLLTQGKSDEALPLLQQAQAISPKNPSIHEQLGHLYLRADRLPEAQVQFEAAVALSPKRGAYHFLLGQVYRREGLAAKAKAEFDQAAALDGTRSSGP